MNDNSPFLELFQPCDKAVQWLSNRLRSAGMQVVRTFNLQDARPFQAKCPCPHHGTAECNCQMVVLLVYQGKQGPVTVTAHGHDRQTWFALVDTAEQPADPHLAEVLYSLAISDADFGSCLENQAHAN